MKKARIIALLTTLVFAIVGIFAGVAPEKVSAKEGEGWFCKDESIIGTNMNTIPSKGSIDIDAPAKKITKRFNYDELFGGLPRMTVYKGEGHDQLSLLTYQLHEARVKGILDGDSLQKAKSVRSLTNCTIDGIAPMVVGASEVLVSIPVKISTMVISVFFNPRLFCGAADEKGCIDIGGIIGGSGGSGGGIIGSLTSSLFLPLSALVASFSAFMVFMNVVRKKAIREGLIQMAWIVGSFIAFLVLLLSPQVFARGPMALTNAVLGCVAGSLSGGSCDGGSNTQEDNGKYGSSMMCAGYIRGASVDEAAKIASSNLNCTMNKTLFMETVANSHFGMSLSELDTHIETTTFAKAATEAGIPLDTYCVPMQTEVEKGATRMKVAGRTFSGPKICNALVYASYLQSGAKGADDFRLGPENGKVIKLDDKNSIKVGSGAGKFDTRWYNIIKPMAHTDAPWNTFTGSFVPTVMGSMGDHFLAFVASVLAGGVAIHMGILGLVYLVSGTVMLAFSPFFALIGMHPTRGKRIFFGYLGKVLSAIAKAIVTSVIILVYITVVGGVVSASGSQIVSLILMIVFSIAMFMYRKEFINLLGTIDLGGENFGRSAGGGQALKNMSGKIKRTIGGSAAGAVMGPGRTMAERFQSAKKYGAEAGKRELARGTGVVAGAFQQGNRVSAQRRAEARTQMQDTARKRSEITEEVGYHNSRIHELDQLVEAKNTNIDRIDSEIDLNREELAKNIATVQNVEGKHLGDLLRQGIIGATEYNMLNSVNNYEAQIAANVAIAKTSNDPEVVKRHTAEADRLEKVRDQYLAGLNKRLPEVTGGRFNNRDEIIERLKSSDRAYADAKNGVSENTDKLENLEKDRLEAVLSRDATVVKRDEHEDHRNALAKARDELENQEKALRRYAEGDESTRSFKEGEVEAGREHIERKIEEDRGEAIARASVRSEGVKAENLESRTGDEIKVEDYEGASYANALKVERANRAAEEANRARNRAERSKDSEWADETLSFIMADDAKTKREEAKREFNETRKESKPVKREKQPGRSTTLPDEIKDQVTKSVMGSVTGIPDLGEDGGLGGNETSPKPPNTPNRPR